MTAAVPAPARARPARVRRQFERLEACRRRLGTERSRLVQARALILCALPYQATSARSVTRSARVGRDAYLRVTFTSVDDGVPLAFGADRALLGWLQTKAFDSGIVALDSLSEFFRAFGLGASGREYRHFRQRLRRLESLAITIEIEDSSVEARLRLHPLKRSLLPRGARASLPQAPTQAILVRHRYGFELDPDFWAYLRANPVPLPLPLMRLFHNRPKAWDFAAFALYRAFAAQSPSVVPWTDLLEQIGSQDRNPRRLKVTLARVLREICVVLPGFPVRFLPGFRGLAVAPWQPDRSVSP